MRIRLVGLILLPLTGACLPHPSGVNYVPPGVGQPTPATPAATQPTTGRKLSVRDCVAIALQRNRQIGIADRRILISNDQIWEARAGHTPKVSVGGRFTADSDNTRSPQDRDVFSGAVTTVVPIYDFGLTDGRIDAAKMRREAAEYNAQQARQDLEMTVSQAYYRVLEAQRIVSVVEESIRVVDRQRQISEDFLTNGLVASNDVLAVRVQLAQRQQELTTATSNLQLARATLNRVMGSPLDDSLVLEDALEAATWNGNYTRVLTQAIQGRPELGSLKKQVDAAVNEYRSARGGMLPNMYLFGSLNGSSDQYLLRNDWLSGGIAMEWPIFDGGYTLARLRRATKELQEGVDMRNNRIDDIVLDIKRAYLSLRDAADRLPVSKQEVALAEENLRVTTDRYQQGLLTSADVLTEEDRLSRARSSYYQALYSYHRSYAQLARECGSNPLPQ